MLEYVLTSNTCKSWFSTYIKIYKILNLESKIELVDKMVACKRSNKPKRDVLSSIIVW